MTLLDVAYQNDLGALEADEAWSFKQESRPSTTALSHSYHRYPAKFIPQIVNKLIRHYTSEGDLVVDPFGGCGTTLVEAKLLGRSSMGFDINPIAKLITQAKITAITPDKLKLAHHRFLDAYNRGCVRAINHHPKIHYWFDKQDIQRLNKIYCAINALSDYQVRRFYMCAFSHNLKNASRWLMKSIKPTIDPNKQIENPFITFQRHISHMSKKNALFYQALLESDNLQTQARVYQCDSTKKWREVQDGIDLIVTSPPYVTSYEYADLHQLPLLWFSGDSKRFRRWHKKFSKEFVDFRREFIGTNSKPEKRHKSFNSITASNIVEELSEVSKPLAKNVANYFIDMKNVFHHMFQGLKPNGVASVIIGDTTLKGVGIQNAKSTIEQMITTGFRPIDVVKRELSNKMITPWRDSDTGKFTGIKNPRRHRVYDYEYVIVMQKQN